MNTVKKSMLFQLVAAGIPVIGLVANSMGISGSDVLRLLDRDKLYEKDVARAIAEYINEIILAQSILYKLTDKQAL